MPQIPTQLANDLKAQRELVLTTGMFDGEWYSNRYPDVKRRNMDPLDHYLMIGGKAQYPPSQSFDITTYLNRYPELRYNRIPALLYVALEGTEKGEHAVPFTGPELSFFKGKSPYDLRADQIKYEVRPESPVVGSITAIIPTMGKNMELLGKCLKSLSLSTHVILVANGPHVDAIKKAAADSPSAVILPWDKPFNWSAANNFGAEGGGGDFLLFLNDDLYGKPGWDRKLLELFTDPRVNVAAPVIFNPDGTVQSAGCYRVPNGCTSAHITFRPVRSHMVESVMGAAMMVRRDTFERHRGFDEAFAINAGDTDFCFRAGGCAVHKDAHVYHKERSTRGPYTAAEESRPDVVEFKRRYPLPKSHYVYSKYLPVPFPDRPLRVLVMKLDHIGDAWIAKQQVENWQRMWLDRMEVSWLVNPVTCSLFDRPYTYLYSNEDASGGLAKFDPQNWQKFVDNLPDYDMVIDLRAHGCTRNLLSAWEWRGTLCFSFGDGIYPDYNGANPQKLLHNGQALAAFLASIPLYKSMGTAKGKKIGICTSASSPVKRWPYWQNLVDRLCEAGLEVVQFAGPGNDKLTGCKVRQVPLNQIVRAIRNECSVYIGHDSGPTHLAASSGVPVISVVGGLVRPEEWQPIGDATTITCPTPCHGCYGQPCRIGDVRCLRWIPLEDVFREALRKAFY